MSSEHRHIKYVVLKHRHACSKRGKTHTLRDRYDLAQAEGRTRSKQWHNSCDDAAAREKSRKWKWKMIWGSQVKKRLNRAKLCRFATLAMHRSLFFCPPHFVYSILLARQPSISSFYTEVSRIEVRWVLRCAEMKEAVFLCTCSACEQ